MTPTDTLEAVRTAWHTLRRSEAEAARLQRYPRLSKAMKDDLYKHGIAASRAQAELARLLADPPTSE